MHFVNLNNFVSNKVVDGDQLLIMGINFGIMLVALPLITVPSPGKSEGIQRELKEVIDERESWNQFLVLDERQRRRPRCPLIQTDFSWI